MTRKGLIGVATLTLLVVVMVGCTGKKKTQPAPTIEPTTVEPQEVTPPPTPMVQDEPEWYEGDDLVAVTDEASQRGLLGDVFFDFDKYDLKPEARERLAKNARFFLDRPEFTVTIEGHCDERGTNDYNLALGERRAGAAKDYLASLGVPAERLRTISYGEERGFCRESSEACWAQNRRAHFRITGRTNVGG